MKAEKIPSVKLRVTIVVDIDANDYLEAGEHQRKIEKHLDELRSDYPAASLSLRQRRQVIQSEIYEDVSDRRERPHARSSFRVVSAGVPSGHLNEYE